MTDGKPSTQTFTLNTGDKIPAIGLGTWQPKPEGVAEAVSNALKAGYRHIDTAFGYHNEDQVGQGVRDSGIPRKDIWITSKLDNTWHKKVPEGIDATLKALGTDYVDLYLMHWPISVDANDESKPYADWTFIDTWHELQKLPATGKARNIGVSNFSVANLEKLLADPSCKIPPAVNQIEIHPYYPSTRLLRFCQSKGVHCTAYSCLGAQGSKVVKDETLVKLAESKGKSVGQVMLKWGVQRGSSVIPKSFTPSRMQANLALDEWELTSEEVAQIDAITSRHKVCGDGFLPAKVFFGDDE